MEQIILLDQQDQATLMRAVGDAKASGREFRIAIVGDQVQWKVGGGVWSPGYGGLDPESGYAQQRAEQGRWQDHWRGDAAPFEVIGEVTVAFETEDLTLRDELTVDPSLRAGGLS